MTFPFIYFFEKNASFFIMFLFFSVCPENAEHFPWAEEENAGNFPQMRVAVSCGHLRSLALGGLLRSLEWLQALRGHLRSLAVTRVAASGCKWLIFPKSNTASLALGGHLRSLAVTRVAASG